MLNRVEIETLLKGRSILDLYFGIDPTFRTCLVYVELADKLSPPHIYELMSLIYLLGILRLNLL